MQRFFTVMLCFSVLLLLFGCATTGAEPSASEQQPALQLEAKAATPTPGTTETNVAQATPGTAGTSTVQAAPGTRPPGPAVIVPESTFDFGVMREDKDYSHAFIIQNVGTSVLIIKKVQPG